MACPLYFSDHPGAMDIICIYSSINEVVCPRDFFISEILLICCLTLLNKRLLPAKQSTFWEVGRTENTEVGL